jgi:hypothetical protein
MDVEFGFVRGRLALFQIRPYAESRRAQRNEYLLQLDAQRRSSGKQLVDLIARP